jgi:hypothetical protein
MAACVTIAGTSVASVFENVVDNSQEASSRLIDHFNRLVQLRRRFLDCPVVLPKRDRDSVVSLTPGSALARANNQVGIGVAQDLA